MKLVISLFVCLLFTISALAQNDSEIKNNGDKNEFNVTQIGADSANNSKINNKGKQNKFNQKQQGKTAYVDSLKVEKSLQDTTWSYINNGNVLFGLIASLLTIGLAVWQAVKRKTGES